MPRSLCHKAEFARVYAEGVKRVGRLLVLYLLPAEDDAQAVVASRKIGKAVQRNRAKRLLREALRTAVFGPTVAARARISSPVAGAPPAGEAPGGGPGGLWTVAIARQEIKAARLQDVQRELEKLILS